MTSLGVNRSAKLDGVTSDAVWADMVFEDRVSDLRFGRRFLEANTAATGQTLGVVADHLDAGAIKRVDHLDQATGLVFLGDDRLAIAANRRLILVRATDLPR